MCGQISNLLFSQSASKTTKHSLPEHTALLNCIRTQRRKCNSHPTYCNLSKLHNLEIQLQHKLTEAKCTYEKYLIEKFTLPKIYSTLTSHGAIPPTVTLATTSDGDKVTMFNTFSTLFTHTVHLTYHFQKNCPYLVQLLLTSAYQSQMYMMPYLL